MFLNFIKAVSPVILSMIADSGIARRPVLTIEGGAAEVLPSHYAIGTLVRKEPKIGRNEPCSCGSSKKRKVCCG